MESRLHSPLPVIEVGWLFFISLRVSQRLLEGEGLLSLLLRILLVRSRVESSSHEHHAVVIYSVLVSPLLWLEEALYRDHGTFCEAIEGVTVLVLAPSLDVHEGRRAGSFLTVLLCTAYCE